MPHFIVECSENSLLKPTPAKVIEAVHDAADDTGLFDPGNIKVRLSPYPAHHFTVGGTKADFIHVIGFIMGGRTTEQKKKLSQDITLVLKGIFPEIEMLSIDIRDIDPQTYTNKKMV